ncbi:hypothetical protein BC936DRAFT_138629 [Jimgerdemannia flammicorona]|uniref:Receptor L-domain domain-containing protein n=1 Tax=Jimgerdemannia flammicorona TaxID=994334 RepID=A0A433DIB8_9FUNG|nr:hypothetical protein BC936DRAFT_138629 [Jimgerdemannia flammicorona]
MLDISTGQAGAGCSRELPVQSQSDLDSISNCQTFTGTITIANLGIPTITLAGVQVINGNLLLANNLNTARVSFPNLQGVTGQLSITNHTVMSTLDMPALTDVDSFSVLVAPALDALVFPQGLNQVNSLHIADTYITKAAGLSFTRATSVIVSNNLYLKLVDLPRLELTKGIYVTANGQNSVDVEASDESHFTYI